MPNKNSFIIENLPHTADKKYDSIEDDSDSDFNEENSILNDEEEEYETDDSEDFIDVD